MHSFEKKPGTGTSALIIRLKHTRVEKAIIFGGFDNIQYGDTQTGDAYLLSQPTQVSDFTTPGDARPASVPLDLCDDLGCQVCGG